MQTLGIDIGGSGIARSVGRRRKGVMATKRHRIATPQPSTPEANATVVQRHRPPL